MTNEVAPALAVYLARDTKHDRLVALKVIHPELAAVIRAERFLAGIRVTANLQHPPPPLFDSGQAEGLLYYVLPFVADDHDKPPEATNSGERSSAPLPKQSRIESYR